MAASAFGIISSADNTIHVEGLHDYRPIGAFSFLGRFRVIDFPISNMSNSGIDRIQVYDRSRPRSIAEHVGSGRHYNINSKRGKIQLLFSTNSAARSIYNNDINAYNENLDIIQRMHQDYVIIAPSYMVYKQDYKQLLDAHIASGADITLLYHKVDNAREYFKNEYPTLNEAQIEDLVKKDIRDGVQTLQYQILTLQTTNGQTPFVSVCLYLNEAENEEEKENLALVIEEILKQRIKGVKNENGQYYANPFPKLLYVLEEDNIHEGDKYYYLTKLAAECTTKRMVPDYISEKVMKKLKISKKGEEGDCYPCMGCRSFLTPYRQPKHDEILTFTEDVDLDVE